MKTRKPKQSRQVIAILLSIFIVFLGYPVSKAADFDADVIDVYLSPTAVDQGDEADICIDVENLADYNNGYNGYGTYDIRICVWKPSGYFNHWYWNNFEMSYQQIQTFIHFL